MRTQRINRRRAGFSLMELLIVVAILMILGAVAVPKIGQALINAKEMAATREIHNLNQAQIQYMSQFGRYATSLTELGTPASGQPSPSGAGLVSDEMTKGVKNGYQFVVQGTQTGFTINANPISAATGRRTFYCDQTGVIRENFGMEPATANSPELGAAAAGGTAGGGQKK